MVKPSSSSDSFTDSSSEDFTDSSSKKEEVAPLAATTPNPKPANLDSSSSDESDSGDDEQPPPHQEQLQPPPSHLSHSTHVASTSKPQNLDPASREEDDADGSDSDDDNDKPPPQQLQPPPPLSQSTLVADPSIKPISGMPLPTAAPSIEKKPEDEHENREVQKRFQRIWSEKDEVAILRGLLDYRNNNGHLPSPSDIKHFNESIKGDIHIKATDKQLIKKVRALKQKFTKPSSRSKTSSSYELSKEVWGENTSTPHLRKRKKTLKDCDDLPPASKKFKREEEISTGERPMYPLLRETMLKLGSEYPGGLVVASREMELIDNAEAASLEERFKKLQLLRMEHCIEEMGIMNEMLKQIVDG